MTLTPEREGEAGEDGRFAFDADGHSLRLACEALRMRLAYLFDRFLAVRSSRIDPLPHQLRAVYEEMLPRPSLRFLLADDPGAGKTVMAGLFVKELLLRGDLERCLIVVPGSLTEQWQYEFKEKFDLDFDIDLPAGESVDFAGCFDGRRKLIARLDVLARRDELKRELRESEDWDLIICDEAHRMSASHYGREVKRTKRYRLGELLSSRARRFLLMTATPHNGKDEDFRLFMSLLDADRIAGDSRSDGKTDAQSGPIASGLMRRMIKEELRDFDGAPLFPPRKAATVRYELSPLEMRLYESVTRYVREEMNRAEKLLGNNRRRNNIGFALQILQRRLASSPAAIHESLKRRLHRLRERHALGDAWQTSDADAEEADDDPEDELGVVEERIVDEATAASNVAELGAEISSLERLEELARAVRDSREDAKWRELDKLLDLPEMHDGEGDIRRKLVIFTESRDTLQYLADRIRDRTGEAESVAVIHGGVAWGARRDAIAAFNNDPQTRFLIANDAAGEGVNLQRGAHLMVNYDLPWNPNRLEQRFGRIHRIGQKETCHLWNLVAHQTREGAVYARLLDKLESARASLQGKVYDVLGDLFEERSLRDILLEAVRRGDDSGAQERLLDGFDGELNLERMRAAVSKSKLASQTIAPARLEDMAREMERAEANRLQPHYVRAFFVEAFARAGGAMRRREGRLHEIKRVPPALLRLAAARNASMSPRYERVCFDKGDALAGHGRIPLLAPGHPLVDASVEWVLAEYRDALRRGAILVDDNSNAVEPRILFCFQHAVQDGVLERGGARREISRRLQFVYLDKHGAGEDGGPAPYLDCRPLRKEEASLARSVLAEEWLADKNGIAARALACAAGKVVPRHLNEVKSRRLAEIDRAEAAVVEHLNDAIFRWDQQAARLLQGERVSERARENALAALARVRELKARKERREEEFARERDIVSAPPEIEGAALVIPAGWFAARGVEVSRPAEVAPGMQEAKDAVERLAMDEVMAAERACGRQPADVSAENRGYDIESRDPRTGRLLFIEVKGRAADARDITLTSNEARTAFNKPQEYVLAIVLVEAGGLTREPAYVWGLAEILGAEPAQEEDSRNLNVRRMLARAEPPR